MEFVELSDAEFRKFEQKNKCGNFFQSVERKELRSKMGWATHLLGVKEGNKVLAGGFLMMRDGNALVQLGPILNYEDKKVLKFWIQNVIKFAKEQNAICLEVFPPYVICERGVKGEVLSEQSEDEVMKCFMDAGFEYEGKTIELENKANRWMAVKKLDGLTDMAAVRATYKKNVRNKLRKISPELEVYELKSIHELPEFAYVVDESNNKNDVVSRSLAYYEWMWDAWGDNLRVILARRKEDGAVVAGRMLIYHPNEVVSFISGTAQNFKKYNGMTFLQDWLLEDCLKRGIKRVNFYGIDGIFEPSNHLLEFKSGFGVVVEEYIGGFRLVLDERRYKIRKVRDGALGFARKVKHESITLATKLRKRQTKVVRKISASGSEEKDAKKS